MKAGHNGAIDISHGGAVYDTVKYIEINVLALMAATFRLEPLSVCEPSDCNALCFRLSLSLSPLTHLPS